MYKKDPLRPLRIEAIGGDDSLPQALFSCSRAGGSGQRLFQRPVHNCLVRLTSGPHLDVQGSLVDEHAGTGLTADAAAAKLLDQ